MTALRKHSLFLALILALFAAPLARAQQPSEVPVGEATERQLSVDDPLKLWARDPHALDSESGDVLQQREVTGQQAKIVKLKNVVPPIHFGSGAADIPTSTIEKLRSVLDGMRDLPNVRLHLVGHADSQPLSERLTEVYGDNAGLSRERAGQVAEFLQNALGLPPEAMSFEWAGDTAP
ncbi:MAG TPA: OmpA family protein, partial [Myxococcota bacterium]|nr:OmpA family protein [Myxococcota bacterium]